MHATQNTFQNEALSCKTIQIPLGPSIWISKVSPTQGLLKYGGCGLSL
jgi:hypothetical protein